MIPRCRSKSFTRNVENFLIPSTFPCLMHHHQHNLIVLHLELLRPLVKSLRPDLELPQLALPLHHLHHGHHGHDNVLINMEVVVITFSMLLRMMPATSSTFNFYRVFKNLMPMLVLEGQRRNIRIFDCLLTWFLASASLASVPPSIFVSSCLMITETLQVAQSTDRKLPTKEVLVNWSFCFNNFPLDPNSTGTPTKMDVD